MYPASRYASFWGAVLCAALPERPPRVTFVACTLVPVACLAVEPLEERAFAVLPEERTVELPLLLWDWRTVLPLEEERDAELLWRVVVPLWPVLCLVVVPDWLCLVVVPLDCLVVVPDWRVVVPDCLVVDPLDWRVVEPDWRVAVPLEDCLVVVPDWVDVEDDLDEDVELPD